MPRIANIRARAFRNLLLRMGFEETSRNHHWHYQHRGLKLRTKVSFGTQEIQPPLMGTIVTKQLQMSEAEFRAALDGDIPERFTNPKFWGN